MVTVGHAPRTDLSPDMIGLLGDRYEVTQMGSLDAFSVEDALSSLAPQGDEETTVTRLRDGTMATLSTKLVLPYLRDVIKRAGEDSQAVILMCTGKFQALECPVPLLVPYELMHSIVPVIASGVKIGALFPMEEYAEDMLNGWRNHGLDVVYGCMRPPGTEDDLRDATANMKDIGLLLLDCIGYTAQIRDTASDMLGVPVLHPKTLMARVLDTLANQQ